VSDDPFGDLAYRHIWHPINQLSDEERSQIEAYAVGGFRLINAALRGHAQMTSQLQHDIETIRAALHRFTLETDSRVTREVGAAGIGLPSADAAPTAVGELFYEAGFLSTSMNEIPPRSTTHVDPIDLDLRLPAGTPALAVGSLSEFPLERELLVVDARRIFIVESRWSATAQRWRLYGDVLPEGGLA
jgi:ADP-ribosyltransferase exoenzyme